MCSQYTKRNRKIDNVSTFIRRPFTIYSHKTVIKPLYFLLSEYEFNFWNMDVWLLKIKLISIFQVETPTFDYLFSLHQMVSIYVNLHAVLYEKFDDANVKLICQIQREQVYIFPKIILPFFFQWHTFNKMIFLNFKSLFHFKKPN